MKYRFTKLNIFKKLILTMYVFGGLSLLFSFRKLFGFSFSQIGTSEQLATKNYKLLNNDLLFLPGRAASRVGIRLLPPRGSK